MPFANDPNKILIRSRRQILQEKLLLVTIDSAFDSKLHFTQATGVDFPGKPKNWAE